MNRVEGRRSMFLFEERERDGKRGPGPDLVEREREKAHEKGRNKTLGLFSFLLPAEGET